MITTQTKTPVAAHHHQRVRYNNPPMESRRKSITDFLTFTVFIVVILVGNDLLQDYFPTALAFVAIAFMGLTLTIGCARQRTIIENRPHWHEIGFSKPKRIDLLWGLANAAITLTISWVFVDLTHYYSIDANEIPTWAVGMGAMLPLLAGEAFRAASEEVAFRGYMIPRLERAFGSKGAVLASSVMFGILHYPYVSGLVLMGAVDGLIFLKTRRLWATILGHSIHNGVIYGTALLNA